ncbi:MULTISPECIES: c-type cytochrome [unclassified Capnocytophaga]|jgi:cytochrome c family protein|uniref:c-type cytochrome n=1 Tax=unclassified Capnocytophaga TaxID=2640652 RepID=UPI000202ED03|nr:MULTISPECIES: c-type cytochrome [unclassified Capnocytophaga]EGD34896.1 cytochrome c [Capnocytophaga sp. oral taxon 338 str. F0234]MEB3004627.1 c-type cytochrome [Capnocytophaga sp. G2]
MKKSKNHKGNALRAIWLLAVFFPIYLFGQEASGDPVKGKDLFKANCAACHKLEGKLVGPPLGGITEKRSAEWLHKWIKNSKTLIDAGDKDAVAVFEEYNKVPMLAYETILSDQDIDNVLAYVTDPSKAEAAATPAAPATDQATAGTATSGGDTPAPVAKEKGKGSLMLVLLLGCVVLLLVFVFVIIKSNREIRKLAKENNSEAYLKQSKYYPLWNIFVKNKIIVGTLIVVLFFSSTYFAFGYLMQVGIDQGYQPIQEIHYSHKIHAGDNQIDCKFCHSAARTSKTAGIPSLNVCMNCHKTIDEYTGPVTAEYTKEFYDGEIKKLYDAVGWDAENARYTGVQKPVKWTRIHNLPDHVYFNHSQHVTAANIACQQCHGDVQTMEVVEQHAPLTMGWCINCHRTTNVDDANPYYEKIHEQLAKKYGKEKLTIAELGGLECGKCHY